MDRFAALAMTFAVLNGLRWRFDKSS